MTDDRARYSRGRLQLHDGLQRAFARTLIYPDWPMAANVRAIVTTREGPAPAKDSPYGFNVGTRCGDDPAAVARNRTVLRDALALPAEPFWLHQVHGTAVLRIAQGVARDGPEPEADAVVTSEPDVVLAIQTADCLPVLFCAEDGSEIAAAHAGWRGLAAGVLEATLGAMQSERVRIVAWLGPAIAARSYEVGAEVRDAFLAHDSAAAAAFAATRPGHWQCDLYALARQRLRAAGITRACGGGFDTFGDPRLHSYRRDGAMSGRMVSLLWMARR